MEEIHVIIEIKIDFILIYLHFNFVSSYSLTLCKISNYNIKLIFCIILIVFLINNCFFSSIHSFDCPSKLLNFF